VIRRVATWLVVGALAAICVGLAVQVHHVYDEGGELRLMPSAAPPVIHLWGRDYTRGDRGPATSLPARTHSTGRTPGGGTVYSPDHVSVQGTRAHVVPTVLWVRDSDGVVAYALSGGP
jgi:hypothetical protein